MPRGWRRFYDKYQVGPAYLAEFIESAGSRGHGWHREGRAMEAHPSPFWEYSALLYAVSTRDVTPSTHDFFFLNGLYGYPNAPKDPSEISPQLLDLSERLYGTREAVHPGTAGIENVTLLHQHRAIIKDSMAFCDWVFPIMRRGFRLDRRAQGLHRAISMATCPPRRCSTEPCTGIDMDIREMESPIAERIVNLERCIEVRNNGRDRELDEAVIPHYQWPEKTDGTHISEDASEFRALLDRYYDLRGWDRETGYPDARETAPIGAGGCGDLHGSAGAIAVAGDISELRRIEALRLTMAPGLEQRA